MYRKKYYILITEDSEYEYIINIFENIGDFGRYYNITYNAAKSELRRYYFGENKSFQRNYKIEFVEEL